MNSGQLLPDRTNTFQMHDTFAISQYSNVIMVHDLECTFACHKILDLISNNRTKLIEYKLGDQ